MDINLLWIIIGAVLAILSGVFAYKWIAAKVLLKEVGEAITALSECLEDDKITDAERGRLLKECRDVITAAAKLFGK